MKKILLSVIIITCIFRVQVSAASVAGTVEKGNRLYHEQKYEGALKHYDQALAKQPDSTIINFNSGAAQYKTKEYQKASSSFEKSLITDDHSLESKANYNLGNSRYMLGLSKENADLSAAVQLLEGALNNYKRTQELTPKDEDAKVNYKIVEKKLKELKEKLKQQPQENKNSQKQKNQDQKQEQNQSPNQAKDSQSASAAQGESQAGKEKPSGAAEQEKQEKSEDKQGQDQQARQQSGKEEQEKQGQPATAQSPAQSEEPGRASAQGSQEPKEMSKEEANMLLEGYRQEENTAGMLKDDKKGTEEQVLKDW